MTNEILRFENISSDIFEFISHGIIYYDNCQNIIFINSAASNILGISGEQNQPKTLESLKWEIIHFEGDEDHSVKNPFLDLLAGGKKKYDVIFSVYNFEQKNHEIIIAKIIPQYDKNQNRSDRAFIVFDIKNGKPISLNQQPGGIELLYSILNQIPDTIYIKDKNSRFIHINKAQAKMLGIASPEAAVGKSDFDFFPIGHARMAYDDEQRIIRTGIAVKDKAEFIKRENKRAVWMSSTKIPIRDKTGIIIGTAGISRDITEKKINEELLKKSETQLRAIWENSFDGMRLINSEGIILLVNEALCNLIGKKRKDLLGADYSEIYNSAERERALRMEQNNISGARTDTFNEKYVTMRNGIKTSLEISHTFIKAEKGAPLLLSIFRDITESNKYKEALKAEKEELDVTLKSIADGVITTDLDDRIKIVNNAAEGIFGWERSEIIGKSIFEVFELVSPASRSDLKESQTSLPDLRSLKKYYSEGELVVISPKEGSNKILTFISAEIKNQEKKSIGFVYVLRDITERVRVEAQLNLSQKMESIGHLAAGIAHEINTPMQYLGDNNTFIKESVGSLCKVVDFMKKELPNCSYGGCQFDGWIKEQELSLDLDYLLTEIPVALEQSRNGIERVNTIISAMTEFAHPGGREKGFFNINKGIEVTVTVSKNEWKYAADIVTRLDPQLPLVFCSLDEINQVILNMIVNSTHAIKELIGEQPDIKGKITIETNYSKEKEQAEIKIIDTGAGISQENLSRIFDPFFTTKRVGKGTGQGLSIAHNIIVNKHNGEIFVESAKGKGTSFSIYLPLNQNQGKGGKPFEK
ncbi:MAG: PAS domain S-box protein [Methanococcaceae archaeon]